MSEKKRQFETDIVINDKSQITVARHLGYIGIFNKIYCKLTVEYACKNFKISQHVANLQARKHSVCLDTVMLKEDGEAGVGMGTTMAVHGDGQ